MIASAEQVGLFWSVFKGRADVYGTYDPRMRRVWQVKQPVTPKVIRAHLQGQRPFGVYLLNQETVYELGSDLHMGNSEARGCRPRSTWWIPWRW